MPRWRQDRETGELILVEAGVRAPQSAAVHGDIEPFVSPIDRKVIGSKRALRAHNRRHGVVQHREYGENEGQSFFQRASHARNDRYTSNTRRDREERRQALSEAIDKHTRR